jgi:hypothetical protein
VSLIGANGRLHAPIGDIGLPKLAATLGVVRKCLKPFDLHCVNLFVLTSAGAASVQSGPEVQ